MKKLSLFNFIVIAIILAIFLAVCFFGCDYSKQKSSDMIQQDQQETIFKEASAQIGMPNIKYFTERKLLKMILELRDRADLITYTYLYNEFTGKLVFFHETIGFGIPYATQFTNPQKFDLRWVGLGANDGGMRTIEGVIPQADPNGLYSPQSAEATWLLIRDDDGSIKPIYVENRVIISPIRLD